MCKKTWLWEIDEHGNTARRHERVLDNSGSITNVPGFVLWVLWTSYYEKEKTIHRRQNDNNDDCRESPDNKDAQLEQDEKKAKRRKVKNASGNVWTLLRRKEFLQVQYHYGLQKDLSSSGIV